MIKKLIYLLLSIVVVVALAGVALVAFIDPNDFKPLITEQVKKITGRDLRIDGEVSWQFWPNLGISIEQVALTNPEGFAEKNLAQFSRAELAVAVLPLISHTIEVKSVRLHGVRIFIQTLSDGTTNLDGLTGKGVTSSTAEPAATTEPAPAPQAATAWQVEVNEIDIQKASALIRDDKTDTVSEVTELDLRVEQLSFDHWSPVQFTISGKQNSLDFSLKGSTELRLTTEVMMSQLKNLTLQATVNDQTQQLAIDALSLTADQLGLATPAALALEVKGKAAGLRFDSKGRFRLQIAPDMALLNVNDIDVHADLAGKTLPKPEMAVALVGDLFVNSQTKQVNAEKIALTLDGVDVSGKTSISLGDIPKVRFDLKSKEVNLDTLLGLDSAKAAKTDPKTTPAEKPNALAANKPKPALSDAEPDLSALTALDIAGKIAIDNFTASKVKVSDVVTDFAIDKGLVTLKQFDAKLYQGTIAATAELDARVTPARYKVVKNIQNVKIQPLLMDAAELNILAGSGNIKANLHGVGLSPLRLRKGVQGTVAASLANGVIYGVNIAQMLREAKALLKGGSVSGDKGNRQTDFSASQATFALANGVATAKNMLVQSPGIRIKNEGSTNLVNETLDFTVFASVVETSKGQGSEDLADLKGITVPVKVGGTWQQPSYALDVKSLLSSNKIIQGKVQKEADRLHEKAEKELDRFFKGKPEDDPLRKATNDLLNNLFNN